MIKLFVIPYILVGIFTVGLSYNKIFNETYVNFETPACMEKSLCFYTKNDLRAESSVLSFLSGIAWPIYYITYVTDFSNDNK